ncbi:MAG TPA: DapH/DapD/GlmU-related protein [Thermomicrobiaceae bacterium]|nr:DapH/DapD/GlmU-related protein [Thermomicrobiaceae bacterium]
MADPEVAEMVGSGGAPLPHRALTWAVRRVRPGRAYTVDPTISNRSLAEIVARRAVMALRGTLRRPLLAETRGVLFIGNRVSIRNPHLFRAGRGVVIDDGVIIDALGEWGVALGDGVTIAAGTIIKCSGVLWSPGKGLIVGRGSSIGEYSFVGATGGVRIGANVLCGQRVSFHSENHAYDDPERLIRDQGLSRRGIEIDDDCWIGSGAIVLDGVRIERGAVVAAGTVVTRSVDPYTVVAGVPAHVIGRRGQRANG